MCIYIYYSYAPPKQYSKLYYILLPLCLRTNSFGHPVHPGRPKAADVERRIEATPDLRSA